MPLCHINGGTHEDLVLDNDLLIDVVLGDSNNVPTVQNVEEFSLVKLSDSQQVFPQSTPKPYLGSVHLTNEVVSFRDIRDFKVPLIAQAVKEGLS